MACEQTVKRKIAFLQLRDGTGFIQGVVEKAQVSEDVFQAARSMTQESSLYVTGVVREDARSPFGYELSVTNIELIHMAVDYPITPKEHGIEFLMDHRHLWLRSKRQHAIMKIRNEVIRATYEFFNENGFVKVDPPILTGSAPEGTTELFHTKYLMKMRTFLKVASFIWKQQRWRSAKYFRSVRRFVPKIKNASPFN